MKKITNLFSTSAVLAALVAGYSAFAGQWGVEELKTAQNAALETFKAHEGEAAYEAIVGFSIEKNIQGTAGRAKVTYKDEAGVKQTKSFFCHVHGDEGIDCH